MISSIIFDKCGSKDEKTFKEKDKYEILKIFDLIKKYRGIPNKYTISLKNMTEENQVKSFDWKMKSFDETRNHFTEE